MVGPRAEQRQRHCAPAVNMDEERITLRLMEHMKSMEAEMASLRLSEKSFEMMGCQNEG
jgi:hypothetical protein